MLPNDGYLPVRKNQTEVEHAQIRLNRLRYDMEPLDRALEDLEKAVEAMLKNPNRGSSVPHFITIDSAPEV